jgi:hypothetical protein
MCFSPRMRNGKLSDAAARAALNGRVVTNEDQLENPAALEALRRAFA